jgi:hypothetical protein
VRRVLFRDAASTENAFPLIAMILGYISSLKPIRPFSRLPNRKNESATNETRNSAATARTGMKENNVDDELIIFGEVFREGSR